MRAYLGLGSNLGDRWQYLMDAVLAIDERVDVSPVYETDPVGGPADQGAFLNVVVAVETEKTPRQLLELCQLLEASAQRVRVEHWGPRTLDADVLLVGDLVVSEPDLVVPHPLWRERAFVVEPLRDVALVDLAATLPTLETGGIRRVGSLWGDWDTSVTPSDAAAWFAHWERTWAIAGGWAIELFVGHPVRVHADLDVAIARADASALRAFLEPEWELFSAHRGRLSVWDGELRPDGGHQLWCRRRGGALWEFEVVFEDIRNGVLHYRRDPAITVPMTDAIAFTDDGVPYLAPELQLLYKSAHPRARDEIDFAAAAPRLPVAERERLNALWTGTSDP
ncbi:MAG: 2-amino-4-hydroxy-6-hydroxymethyldihydropteridine diphosphokinase [Actinomycetota bacterium]